MTSWIQSLWSFWITSSTSFSDMSSKPARVFGPTCSSHTAMSSRYFNHPSSASGPSIIVDPLRVVDDEPDDVSPEPSIALGLPQHPNGVGWISTFLVAVHQEQNVHRTVVLLNKSSKGIKMGVSERGTSKFNAEWSLSLFKCWFFIIPQAIWYTSLWILWYVLPSIACLLVLDMVSLRDACLQGIQEGVYISFWTHPNGTQQSVAWAGSTAGPESFWKLPGPGASPDSAPVVLRSQIPWGKTPRDRPAASVAPQRSAPAMGLAAMDQRSNGDVGSKGPPDSHGKCWFFGMLQKGDLTESHPVVMECHGRSLVHFLATPTLTGPLLSLTPLP